MKEDFATKVSYERGEIPAVEGAGAIRRGQDTYQERFDNHQRGCRQTSIRRLNLEAFPTADAASWA